MRLRGRIAAARDPHRMVLRRRVEPVRPPSQELVTLDRRLEPPPASARRAAIAVTPWGRRWRRGPGSLSRPDPCTAGGQQSKAHGSPRHPRAGGRSRRRYRQFLALGTNARRVSLVITVFAPQARLTTAERSRDTQP